MGARALSTLSWTDDRGWRVDFAVAGASLLGLVLSMFLMWVDLGSGGRSDAPAVATLDRKTNAVSRRLGSTLVWNSLRPAASLYADDAIFVGPQSEAVISFDDGAQLELDENSLIVLRRTPNVVGQVQPELSVEVMRGGVAARAGSTKMQINSGRASLSLVPKARVTARNGAFTVIEGQATLSDQTGSLVVDAGRRFTAGDDAGIVEGPRAVSVELLAPPAGERIDFTRASPQIAFAWKRNGATSCVLEIAADAKFARNVVRQETTSESVEVNVLRHGIYFWRVSCGDRPSEERKLVVADNSPPLPIRPARDEVVDGSQNQTVHWAWSEVPDVRFYDLEVDNEATQEKELGQQVTGPGLALNGKLPEGRHCYRVRASLSERKQAEWSDATCFLLVLRPTLDAPELIDSQRERIRRQKESDPDDSVEEQKDDPPPAAPPPPVHKTKKKKRGAWLWWLIGGVAYGADDEPSPDASSAIVLRWKKLPGAVSYLLEIAEDREFSHVVLKEKVTSPLYRWFKVVRRAYFWRVRAIDDVGREGTVSSPKRIGSEIAPPKVLSPPSGETFAVKAKIPTVTLRWLHAQAMRRYEVTIATDERFEQIVLTRETPLNKLAFDAPETGRYFWRVQGIDLEGERSPYSDVRGFELTSAGPVPVQPAEKQAIVWADADLAVTLSWSKRRISEYEVEIAHDDRTKRAPEKRASTDTSLTFKATELGGYTWRVRGKTPATPWSAAAHFSVVPPVLQIVRPSDGATIVPDTAQSEVAFEWRPAPGVSGYVVTLIKDDTKEDISLPRAALARVLADGRYTWTVRSTFAGGEGPPSATAHFSVATKRAPVVSAPVVAPRPVAPPVAHEPALRVHAGVRVGFFDNFGPVHTVRGGLELGLRLKAGFGFAFAALHGEYYTATASASDGSISVSSRLHAIPITLMAGYMVPIGRFRPYLAAAGTLTVNLVAVTVQSSASLLPVLTFGVGGGAGCEFQLGPGALFVEVFYSHSPVHTGQIQAASGGISAVGGYRFIFP